MFGNINELIQKILDQQRMMVPPGNIPGVGISDPNPGMIPGPQQPPYKMGPLAQLAQQMAAGSLIPPSAGTPGIPQTPNVQIPTMPDRPVAQGFNPTDPATFLRANPFRQFAGGGGIFPTRRAAY